jgi:hypothetical protein
LEPTPLPEQAEEAFAFGAPIDNERVDELENDLKQLAQTV